MPRRRSNISIHWPLATDLSKIPGCQAAVSPTSERRNTNPLAASVRIRGPLAVKQVTGLRDGSSATPMSTAHEKRLSRSQGSGGTGASIVIVIT